MRKGPYYLRCAAAALFIAACAYTAAAVLKNFSQPETVRAESVTVSGSVSAEGEILLDSYPLSHTVTETDIVPGQRVRAGTALGEGVTAPCAGFFAGDRIVTGGWCFRAEIRPDDRIYPGRRLTLRLDSGEYSGCVMDCDGGSVTVRCREGLTDVLDISYAEAKLMLCDVTGIKLPYSALHRGTDGDFAYIIKAGIEKAVPVTVLYRCDDFCLVDGIPEGCMFVDNR